MARFVAFSLRNIRIHEVTFFIRRLEDAVAAI